MGAAQVSGRSEGRKSGGVENVGESDSLERCAHIHLSLASLTISPILEESAPKP